MYIKGEHGIETDAKFLVQSVFRLVKIQSLFSHYTVSIQPGTLFITILEGFLFQSSDCLKQVNTIEVARWDLV